MSAAIGLPSLAQPVAETKLSGVFVKDLGHSFGETGKGSPGLKMCHINGYFPIFSLFPFLKKKKNSKWQKK